MKISGIINSSLVNGEGMRTVIFTSGCSHDCKDCHALELQDFDYGEEMTVEELMEMIKPNMPLVDGITISGGDPFCKSTELLEILKGIKEYFPEKDIWVYTGFTYEQLKSDICKEALKYIDVLVDGKYLPEEKDGAKKYTGSANQRILKLSNGSIVESL